MYFTSFLAIFSDFTDFFRLRPCSVYKLFYSFVFALFIALLAGCAHTPQRAASVSSLSHDKTSDQKIKLTNWVMEGRIAASNAKGAHSASFVWEQQGPVYKIKFFGPLGIAGGCLKGDLENEKTVFISYNGKKSYAASAQVLLYHQTGLYFPVPSLTYWLQGLADPALKLEYSRYDPAGFMQELKQDGWLIKYVDYDSHKQNADLILPCHLKIKKDDIVIKVIIHSWE